MTGAAVHRLSIALAAFCAAACGQGVYSTTVAPTASEDIAAPCRYELTIPAPEAAVRAVWVIFDRGREVQALYNDPDVFQFAGKEHLAVLLARHCGSKEREDMNADPARGIGRALFTALEQFGRDARRGDVAAAKVIAFGFSGAGALVARLPGYAPERMMAAIAYAPGQYEPLGLDTIRLSGAAAAVPQLIIANSEDPVNGTKRPLDYFERHFGQGAPWVFAIQNGVPHHGALRNTKPLLFAWLESILAPTPQSAVVTLLSPAQRGSGWGLYLRTAPAKAKDEWKDGTVRASGARIGKAASAGPADFTPAGWVATKKAAGEWLAFVRKSRHRVDTSYP